MHPFCVKCHIDIHFDVNQNVRKFFLALWLAPLHIMIENGFDFHIIYNYKLCVRLCVCASVRYPISWNSGSYLIFTNLVSVRLSICPVSYWLELRVMGITQCQGVSLSVMGITQCPVCL